METHNYTEPKDTYNKINNLNNNAENYTTNFDVVKTYIQSRKDFEINTEEKSTEENFIYLTSSLFVYILEKLMTVIFVSIATIVYLNSVEVKENYLFHRNNIIQLHYDNCTKTKVLDCTQKFKFEIAFIAPALLCSLFSGILAIVIFIKYKAFSAYFLTSELILDFIFRLISLVFSIFNVDLVYTIIFGLFQVLYSMCYISVFKIFYIPVFMVYNIGFYTSLLLIFLRIKGTIGINFEIALLPLLIWCLLFIYLLIFFFRSNFNKLTLSSYFKSPVSNGTKISDLDNNFDKEPTPTLYYILSVIFIPIAIILLIFTIIISIAVAGINNNSDNTFLSEDSVQTAMSMNQVYNTTSILTLNNFTLIEYLVVKEEVHLKNLSFFIVAMIGVIIMFMFIFFPALFEHTNKLTNITFKRLSNKIYSKSSTKDILPTSEYLRTNNRLTEVNKVEGSTNIFNNVNFNFNFNNSNQLLNQNNESEVPENVRLSTLMNNECLSLKDNRGAIVIREDNMSENNENNRYSIERHEEFNPDEFFENSSFSEDYRYIDPEEFKKKENMDLENAKDIINGYIKYCLPTHLKHSKGGVFQPVKINPDTENAEIININSNNDINTKNQASNHKNLADIQKDFYKKFKKGNFIFNLNYSNLLIFFQ